jgi:hypothetical protein
MRAPHPAARQSHIELAERYDELAKAIAQRGMELDSRIAG